MHTLITLVLFLSHGLPHTVSFFLLYMDITFSVNYAFKNLFFFQSHTHLTFNAKQKKHAHSLSHTHTYPLYISTFMYIHRKRKILFNVN